MTGPRVCSGDHVAMLEATLVLATLVRRRVEVCSCKADFPICFGSTTVADGPILARVKAQRPEPPTQWSLAVENT